MRGHRDSDRQATPERGRSKPENENYSIRSIQVRGSGSRTSPSPSLRAARTLTKASGHLLAAVFHLRGVVEGVPGDPAGEMLGYIGAVAIACFCALVWLAAAVITARSRTSA